MKTYELIKGICEGLIANYDKDNWNYIKAEEDDMLDNIIELFADCYDAESFLTWLYEHDGDILIDYIYAYRRTYEEIAEELDDCTDNDDCDVCDGVYGVDIEEWHELKTEEERTDYIKNHLDCLMSSDKAVVVEW